MGEMNQEKTRRFDALTGVRILAAAAVFLSHAHAPASIPPLLATFMGSGYSGVTLFFALSGFVLMWSYGERLRPLRVEGLWSFFVARFSRIYPLYLFALLVVIVPQIAASGWDPLMLLHISTLQTWSANVNWAYAFNGPGWSIGVEVFLYACFPLILIGLARIRHSAPALILLGTLIVAGTFALVWWFILTGRNDLAYTDAESTHRWLYRTPPGE